MSEVARSYGVSRSWIYELLARYRAEGEAAFGPRSRRPRSSPSAVSPGTVELIARLRKELAGQGLDAGPHTIAWHLARHHHITVSPATVSRYLARLGLVTPDPAKRPRSSYVRFEAEMPSECWQADFTHYPLAGGAGAEILTWLDDHSRYALSVTAHRRVTAADVLTAFQAASGRHGTPASTLTDNGMVFTTRRHGRGSNLLEAELRRRGVQQKNGKPNHPQTQGKVERFQQTLKKWLAARPAQPATITALQALLDEFAALYNTRRPHRSLPHRAVPAATYAARPKAIPGPPSHAPDQQVRTITTDQDGKILLRLNGRRHHFTAGRKHARTRVLILLNGLNARIFSTTTSELIRELTINPDRDYQPTGTPRGRPANQHPK